MVTLSNFTHPRLIHTLAGRRILSRSFLPSAEPPRWIPSRLRSSSSSTTPPTPPHKRRVIIGREGAPKLPPFAHPWARDELNYSTWDNVAVLVDKPTGWTSNDVCGKLKYAIGRKWKRGMKTRPHKVGHAGTLDPLATGLLIIFFGKATKTVSQFVEQRKEYTGTLRLDEDLEQARHNFIGDLEQIPPMFSAVKVGGSRLYKLARAGQEVERKPRDISIYDFELSRQQGSQDVDFRVACSKGTYVRVIASDLGETLGCGAHIISLRRTAIGPQRVDNAWNLEDLVGAIKESRGISIDKDEN